MHTPCCTFQSIQRSTRLLCLCLLLLLFAGICPSTYASESFTVITDLYQGFDLATGMAELDPTVITIIIGSGQEIETISAPSLDPLFDFSPSIDMYFGFSTDVERPITIIAENLKGMAVFDGTSFNTILDEIMTREVLPTPGPIAALNYHDMVVLVTASDDVILLGDVQLLPDAQVQFTYQIVEQDLESETVTIPGPGTLLLVGAGIVGLLGIIIRTRKSLQGGTRMKHGKMLLFTLLFVTMFAGGASALELQVLVIGRGFVQGEGLGCGRNCTKTYEEGTVVHLKAIPFPVSRFVGWKVDGKLHKGVLTIEEDIVVVAMFERKTEAPSDELRLSWYTSSGGREYGLIALDEVFITFEDREQWGASTEEEYHEAIQKIARTFHPQAEITGQTHYHLSLKLPEPLEKEQWFNRLFALQELTYVRWAGPVLYTSLGNPDSRMIVWDGVSVSFPASYTEEQIETIEQEYGLTRLRPLVKPNSFTYQVGSPLEAIETANRLYESGLVEISVPAVSRIVKSRSDLPNDEFFNKQWHLNNTGVYAGEDINVLPAWEKALGLELSSQLWMMG